MFKPLFHHTLRHQREQLKLSQSAFARRCCIDRGRYAMFELAMRNPSDLELRQIASALGTDLDDLQRCGFRPARYHETLRDNASRYHPNPPPYFPSQDRPNVVRLKAARRKFPALLSALEAHLARRSDAELVAFFCEELACGSAQEFVYLLTLLVRGGLPGLSPPNRYAHPPHPLVDPTNREPVGHRAVPAILMDGFPHFIQASLATPRIYTVDVLRWTGSWSVVEVDGRNPEKDQAVAVPVERLTTDQVIELAWRLLGRLARMEQR